MYTHSMWKKMEKKYIWQIIFIKTPNLISNSTRFDGSVIVAVTKKNEKFTKKKLTKELWAEMMIQLNLRLSTHIIIISISLKSNGNL